MSSTIGIHERDWKVLLGAFERGDCVALVGPNLPTVGSGGERCHLATELSRRLAGILADEDAVTVRDADNLPLVAQTFIDQKGWRDYLDVEVTSFYGEAAKELGNGHAPDAMFQDLAALPLQLFVTSRHDLTLRHYLEKAGKKPIEKHYNYKGDQQRSVRTLGTANEPLVYQLFGSITDRDSLALTESNLLDLLESIISGNPALPIDLQNHFTEKSFLFMGCGLHRDYLRFLLHALGLSRSKQRSFALRAIHDVRAEGGSLGGFDESVWFYEVEYKKLKFLDMDEQTFLREARRRWEERHPEPGFRPAEGTAPHRPVERPKVFISYMREDQAVAERLAGALDASGIEPWIDLRDLRTAGHPDWACSLDDAIGEEVDFFVVVQTQHLADGVETWVHREVALALKRIHMRGAVKFIYPLLVEEGAPRLDALDREHVQAWHVRDFEEDVTELATDMKREFAKLRRGR